VSTTDLLRSLGARRGEDAQALTSDTLLRQSLPTLSAGGGERDERDLSHLAETFSSPQQHLRQYSGMDTMRKGLFDTFSSNLSDLGPGTLNISGSDPVQYCGSDSMVILGGGGGGGGGGGFDQRCLSVKPWAKRPSGSEGGGGGGGRGQERGREGGGEGGWGGGVGGLGRGEGGGEGGVWIGEDVDVETVACGGGGCILGRGSEKEDEDEDEDVSDAGGGEEVGHGREEDEVYIHRLARSTSPTVAYGSASLVRYRYQHPKNTSRPP
jgi:hypothetical protein